MNHPTMTPMKVLIVYDASECSDDMLADLQHAGFPKDVEADVVSFAEVWLTQPEDVVAHQEAGFDSNGNYSESDSKMAFHEATSVADDGCRRIREMFPRWRVTGTAHADAATWGTLARVADWQPDLVVVGSHGRSALGRLIYGSVGQKLLARLPCSVRIARAPYGPQPGGLRVVLAVDGSLESNAAVKVVASRSWPAGTSIRVVAVYDQTVMETGLGVVTAPDMPMFEDDDIALVEERAATAVVEMKRAGLAATAVIARGNPAAAILHEAKNWGADTIFMGARGHGLLERALFGSVSNAVVTGAHCSVEVTRIPPTPRPTV